MAFRNAGPLTYLSGGARAYWWYDWGGADKGFEQASADIKAPNYQTPRHNAFDQGLSRSNSNYVQYYVTIENEGPATSNAWHNLMGGGAA